MENGGEIYLGARKLGVCERFVLMADVKSGAAVTYDALHALLAEFNGKYPGLFTTYGFNETTIPGAVDFLLSGNRVSPQTLLDQPERFAALDGRILDNLDHNYGPEVMPWLSQAWSAVFGLARPPFSESVVTRLAEITGKAHERGQLVRFWETPDDETFWDALLENDVDLINNDDYARLSQYLRN